MKILFFSFFVFLGMMLLPVLVVGAHPAEYGSWSYYKRIDFSDSTPVANYQVKVNLTVANFDYAKAKFDGADLRFADFDDNIVSYFIESWNVGGTSVIWIKVPVSGSSGVNIYYGNTAAVSESSGDDVFDFFDDFSGSTLDNAKWSSVVSGAGSMTVSGGLLDIYQPMEQEKWTEIHSRNLFGPEVILEGRASIDYGGMYIYGSFGWHDQVYPAHYQLFFNDGSSFNDNIRYAAMKNSNLNDLYNSGDINVFHDYKIIWSGLDSRMYLDGVQNFQVTDTNFIPDIPLVVTFYNHTPDAGIGFPNSTENQYLDWVRVRKYNSTTGEIFSSLLGDEEGVSLVTVTATVPSSLSFSIIGVNAGVSCANSGGNSSVATTSSSIPFGIYIGAQTKIACQTLIVSTNAGSGYIVTLQQDQDLTNASTNTIGKFSGNYVTPITWISPESPNKSFFGFTTNDADLVDFQTAKYSQLAVNNTPYVIAQETNSVANEVNVVSYQLEVNNLQEAGIYSNNLIYIATGMF